MRILSIDGGGVRGLIPGAVIVEIEKRTGKPISQLFDLVSGTSAGGHIALALATPGDDGKPKWSAEELAAYYREVLTNERYSADGIDSALNEVFGEVKLSEALIEVLITAFEVEGGEPHFFLRSEARNDPKKDHLMSFAARATSAAPTYFEPAAKFNGEEGMAFLDGALFANNPSMCAFAHAQSLGFDEDEMTIISLGTGAVSRILQYEEVRHWGLANWARPIMDITSQASNRAIDWQLNHILRKGHYFRVQPLMSGMRSAIDDARPETIKALEEASTEVISRHSEDLDKLCQLLSD
jgi:patatin-like phospholipase/acyl hydrolase